MPTAFPSATGFERVEPAAAGLDHDALAEAVDYARRHESDVARDFSDHEARHAEEGEHAAVVGPLPQERGDPNGLVLGDGRIVAEWGPTDEVQLAFSVTKSFLSGAAGVAHDRGLIELDEPVGETVRDGGFEDAHNAQVTWHHLLTQTSEWRGELFGKPDAVDRHRPVARDADALGARGERELREPGTYWEYNDVRINRLALALLRRFERPLPDVLDEAIMTPIGATSDWAWHGYETSWVEVGGERVQSVSGGGHWGGGLWLSARDMARYGLLMLAAGHWDGERVLSTDWVDRALTPCDVEPTYGSLWWLNTDRGRWPSAPADSFAALGYGANVLWIDPTHDLVAVVRWLDWGDGDGATNPVQDGFLERLLAAVEG